MSNPIDLSIVLLAKNEAENLKVLIPQIQAIIKQSGLSYEILVVEASFNEATKQVCDKHNLHFMIQNAPGFGVALADGIHASRGKRILTMDADLQHDPNTIPKMLMVDADLVIGSRWGGNQEIQWSIPRQIISLALNFIFSKSLGISIKDMSSNFRLYRREVFQRLHIEGKNYDALQEVLIKCVFNRHSVVEVSMSFRRRVVGTSNVSIPRFFTSYAKTYLKALRLKMLSI
ncbi:MAG: glycosyltransferase [Candidatus Thorarchaeota archaeon]|nr:glycosyltransferase [Candidatus Thorarchaeota archaeon]